MTDRFRDRLSEYLDGELTPEDSRLVERHLETCGDCARTLTELEAVVTRAARLPRREPPPGVWEAIEARIDADEADAQKPDRASRRSGRRRIAFSIPQLAAAAVTLAALSAGVAWMAGSESPTTTAAEPGLIAETTDARLARDTDLGTADYYAGAIAALESALFDPARPLAPTTEARVRRALMTIDRALEDALSALEEDPTDPYLQDHLTDTMRRKSEFLRQAVKLAAQS